ncbi:hypothetical protein U1Q18_008954, partial [Sarracenia purpurea var. burkii]
PSTKATAWHYCLGNSVWTGLWSSTICWQLCAAVGGRVYLVGSLGSGGVVVVEEILFPFELLGFDNIYIVKKIILRESCCAAAAWCCFACAAGIGGGLLLIFAASTFCCAAIALELAG